MTDHEPVEQANDHEFPAATANLIDWCIVTDVAHIEPWSGKVERWEQCIKVTATEESPVGEFVRDIAWFQPTDDGMELARRFVAMCDHSGDSPAERTVND